MFLFAAAVSAVIISAVSAIEQPQENKYKEKNFCIIEKFVSVSHIFTSSPRSLEVYCLRVSVVYYDVS